MTLTEKRVRNTKPGPKLRMLWDTHIKGLGVRIYSSGVKSYVLSYRTRSDGLFARKRLTTLFPVNIVTLRDVRVQAAKELVAIRNGEPGPRSNAGRQRTSLTPRSKPPVPDARLHSQLGFVKKKPRRFEESAGRVNSTRHGAPRAGCRGPPFEHPRSPRPWDSRSRPRRNRL